jgi:hypothetical protein
MNKPLFWNTLPRAAEWLTEKLSRKIDVLTLIDTVLPNQESLTNPVPLTIIRALIPFETRLAKLIDYYPETADPLDLELHQAIHKKLTKEFGSIPNHMVYTGLAKTANCQLGELNLLDLMLTGRTEITSIHGEHQFYKNNLFEYVWVMPYGQPHIATIESCGIRGVDLLALAEQLQAPPSDKMATSETEQVKPNNSKHWHDIARGIADEIDKRDEAQGARDSLKGIGERVLVELIKRGIDGPRTGATVKRDALQSKKWVRPRNRKLAEETGEMEEADKPI